MATSCNIDFLFQYLDEFESDLFIFSKDSKYLYKREIKKSHLAASSLSQKKCFVKNGESQIAIVKIVTVKKNINSNISFLFA